MHLLRITPLLFALIVNHLQPVYSQCSGTTLILNATDVYQVFTSVNYPSVYSNQQSCEWRIEADNATDAVRLELTDAEIEYHPDCVYDFGEVFDGDNVNATSLGRFCGTANPSYVSIGSNMTVTFSSDYSMGKKGFKARYKSGPRSSLLDEEDESSSIMLFIIVGAAGGFALFLIIAILIYKKTQSKKEKDVRPIQVQPFAVASTWSQRNQQHHPPPVYGGGNASTISPPPRYSDVGLPLSAATHNQAGQFDPNNNGKPGDAIRNTHFVLPDNLRRLSTQIGNNTTQSTGIVANGVKADGLPNEDTTVRAIAQNGTTIGTTAEQSNGNGEAINTRQEMTLSNTNEPTTNGPVNANMPAFPRRNVPGETLSQLLSDDEDDSETDSDDYSDSD